MLYNYIKKSFDGGPIYEKDYSYYVIDFTLTFTSCSHIEDINGPDDYSLATF